MATIPQTDKAPPGKPSNKPKIPPEERFWKRYSPHHEFLLSSTGSGVLHAVAFAVLFFGALLAAMLGIKFDNNVEVDAMVIAGGGGSPSGAEGPTTGIGKGEEVSDLKKTDADKVKAPDLPKESLDAARPTDPDLMPANQSPARPIEDDIGLGKKLNEIGEAARQRLEQALRGNTSKGRGGSGEGGGQGKGKGPGAGDLQGPGRINVTKREQRQLRWTMMFNTHDGGDYVRQLQALKAILAIRGPDGEYLVIDDLGTRPVVPKRRDIQEINRIYWIDDKPESVMSLSRALGLTPVPDHIVAFFPQELEQELLKKELRFRRLPEDKIGETQFKVMLSRGGFEPVVTSQSTLAELKALKGRR
jgi:hypothetical protein